jgi:nicotinamidase-related amidase
MRRPDPRHRLGLLLIDVNNSFFDPHGPFYYPAVAEVVAPLRALLAAARDGGRLLVHAREGHRPGLSDDEFVKLPEHSYSGDWDALPFPGFEERAGEVLVEKRRFSAFFGTDLALMLHEQDTRRLLIAGVKTNVCIRANVTDAFGYGFRPTIALGTVNSNRPHLHEASLEDIQRYIGELVPLETAIDWLRGSAPEDELRPFSAAGRTHDRA